MGKDFSNDTIGRWYRNIKDSADRQRRARMMREARAPGYPRKKRKGVPLCLKK